MGRLQPVKQQYFGQTRSAHVSVNAPLLYDSQAAAIREQGLFSLGRGATNAFNALMGFAEERRDAAVAQVEAEYTSEVQKALDSQVYSLHGEAANNVAHSAEQIFRDARSKAESKLAGWGGRALEKFTLYADRSDTPQISHVARYQEGELRNARVQSGRSIQEAGIKNFAATGDPECLNVALSEGHDATYGAINGRIFDDDTLAEFDANAEKGVVKLGGKTYTVKDGVVHGIGAGGRGVKLADLRGRISKENQAFNQSRQMTIDTAYGSRIDQLTKFGDLDSAERFLAKVTPGSQVRQSMTDEEQKQLPSMSKNAAKAVRSQLDHVLEDRNLKSESYNDVAATVAAAADQDPSSCGGKYYTPGMGKIYANRLQNLTAEAAKHPGEKGWRRVQAFKEAWAGQMEAFRIRQTSDIAALTKEYKDAGMLDVRNVDQLSLKVSALPDSPVKDHFADIVTKNRYARMENRAKDPAYQTQLDTMALNAKRLITLKGTGKDGNGNVYNFAEEKDGKDAQGNPYLGVRSYCQKAGLDDKRTEEVLKFLRDPRVPHDRICTIAATQLNQFCKFSKDGKKFYTPENVGLVMPFLLKDVEGLLQYYIPKKGEDSKKIEDTIIANAVISLCKAYQREEKGWLYGTNTRDFRKYAMDAIQPNGQPATDVPAGDLTEWQKMSMTPEQAQALAKLQIQYNRMFYPAKEGEDVETLQKTSRDTAMAEKRSVQDATAKKHKLVRDPEDGKLYISEAEAEKKKKAMKEKKEKEEKFLKSPITAGSIHYRFRER